MIAQPGASTPKDGMSEVPTADVGDCYVQEVAFARRSVDWQGSINKACVTLWNSYPETPSSTSAGESQEEGPETVTLRPSVLPDPLLYNYGYWKGPA